MSALVWLLPVAALAFLVWCAYDCGKDVGYDRCWNEHHPARDQREGR